MGRKRCPGILLSALIAASALSPLAAGTARAASTATGVLSQSSGVGATTMVVELTSVCPFVITGSPGSNGPGDIIVGGVDVGPAIAVTVVDATGRQLIALPQNGSGPFAVASSVTQANVSGCGVARFAIQVQIVKLIVTYVLQQPFVTELLGLARTAAMATACAAVLASGLSGGQPSYGGLQTCVLVVQQSLGQLNQNPSLTRAQRRTLIEIERLLALLRG